MATGRMGISLVAANPSPVTYATTNATSDAVLVTMETTVVLALF